MCGIVGIIGPLDSHKKILDLEKMNQAIYHRGPDDFGQWANEQAAIGMRRLSIVDLQGGHQPMWHESIGIVFNGEIYNHEPLRAELENLGQTFITDCDTEVILKAYCQWGESFIAKLTGMFAICIVDLNRNTALLIRDHTGIKPLYLIKDQGNLYFASETKSLKSALNINEIDFESIDDYLTFRYIPSDRTAWSAVKKLAPGHYLKINLTTLAIEKKCYWQLNYQSATISKKRDYVQEFDDLFTQSVKSQLEADVPVGAFLSGGLDSTAICAKAVELGHNNFHTFSVAFEGDNEFSELNYARDVANHLGTEHHEVLVTAQQYLDFIKRQPYYTDDPLADLTSVPLYYLALEARKHIKVALSGEGADEVLGGYSLELSAMRAHKRRLTKYIPPFMYPLLQSVTPHDISRQLGAMNTQGWGGYVAATPEYMSINISEQTKKALWKIEQPPTDSLAKIRAEYQLAHSEHPIDKLQHVLSSSWLVDDLLAKADKMSMAASLEVRVPFLDHHLINWAMELPISWKVGDKKSGFISKRVLRQSMKKLIPQSILERKKQGFPIPVYHWLETELGEMLEHELLEPGLLDDWFNLDALATITHLARQGNKQAQHEFWTLYTLGQWKRNWIEA